MKREYHGIRKVGWDRLWHALYFIRLDSPLGVRETYDRVTKKTAQRIAARLLKAGR